MRPSSSKTAVAPKSILRKTTATSDTGDETLFSDSKKDKRIVKRSQFLSKVSKSAPPRQRRRRPNKKLVTTLDSLADALPDETVEDTATNDDMIARTRPEDQVNIIRRKSMKSRPGAMKRKQKLENDEKDRFAKNLAQMTMPTSGGGAASAADKMRALRGFIAQTLETRPEVAKAMPG